MSRRSRSETPEKRTTLKEAKYFKKKKKKKTIVRGGGGKDVCRKGYRGKARVQGDLPERVESRLSIEQKKEGREEAQLSPRLGRTDRNQKARRPCDHQEQRETAGLTEP